MALTRSTVLGLLGLACAVIGMLNVPSATASSRSTSALDTVQIGPVPARDGFEMYVTAQGCGSSDPVFDVVFVAGTDDDVLSHTYAGADGSCTLGASPAQAELQVSLPGTIAIAAQVQRSAEAPTQTGLPVGCGGPLGPEQPAVAGGQIDVAIHPSVFGRLNASRAEADVFTARHPQCPAAQAETGRELTAVVGTNILDAAAPAGEPPQLTIFHSSGDVSATGLTGTLELQISAARAYVLTSRAGSARISALAPFSSGALTFTALPACPGASAVNGTLAGTFTIEDPLLGALAITGANATRADTGIGPARAGGCNGPGSAAVQPALVNNCAIDGSCSVQAQTNTVTFLDETDPGTQTISSEQVDFGDGTPSTPLAPGGVLTHVYAQPGTYPVTLSVVDSAGVTSTSTTTVFIDP